MPNDDDLPIPKDIPWKLACCSQPNVEIGPKETTIAVFYHAPETESLQLDYPDHDVLYLKVTVSIAPLGVEESELGKLALRYLEAEVPVHHIILDLSVTGSGAGAGRPYFHSAAPLRRAVLERGLVGNDLYEGESNHLTVGKSASHVRETVGSEVGSSGWEVDLGVFSIGGGSEDVTSERDVHQVIDSTSRDASQERRELLSHLTSVENVLTLLTAKHLGSPYLRFSLWPRPIRPLSVDPADPNLWFSEFLRRRSSGIEGIQEFVAVVLSPKGSRVCLDARIRRVGVLDVPPEPPRFPTEGYIPTDAEVWGVVDYLHRTYPRGTPIDELDVDLLSAIDEAHSYRPTILDWFVHDLYPTADFGLTRHTVVARILSPNRDLFLPAILWDMNYKTTAEVWLERQRVEYETAILRSPFERGVLKEKTSSLQTCLDRNPDGSVDVVNCGSSDVSIGIMAPRSSPPLLADTPAWERGAYGSTAGRYRAAVVRWNVLLERARASAERGWEAFGALVTVDDDRVADLVARRWMSLPIEHPANVAVREIAETLSLPEDLARSLRSAGVCDVRDLGTLLVVGETLTARAATNGCERKKPESDKPTRGTIAQVADFPLSPTELSRLRRSIGQALERSRRDAGEEEDRE